MTAATQPALLGLAFAGSLALTGLMRRWALHHGVLDLPNARGSHSVPTPRGGGVAIVVTTLLLLLVSGRFGDLVAERLVRVVLGGGVVVALTGFIDDLRGVSARMRLLVHGLACGAGAWYLGAFAPVDVGAQAYAVGVPFMLVAVVAVAWFLNLFNFMDGIDGIASVEVLCVTASAAFLCSLGSPDLAELYPLMLAAAAALGFLVWNWPPARIFMGDAGSGFIGFVIGMTAWATMVSGALSIWVWLILTATFTVDATVTLARRLMRGVPAATPHRSHAYQRLSRRFASHRSVTLGVAAINLLWLLPVAWVAVTRPTAAAAAAVVAWLPLLGLALWAGAGADDE